MNKSRLTAFFLAFIPGAGHFYLNKNGRGFMYLAGFILSIIIGLFISFVENSGAPLAEFLGIAFIIGFINMLDMVITLIREPQQATPPQDTLTDQKQEENQSFYTLLLSFVPGLGHFHLGLMQRGLTFLIGFFGLATMIIFLSAITNQGGFAAFLGILPIIWIYSMFDTTQQLARKKRGEPLVDQTILEDFEETRREQGRKSKALATILSMFPGAGHMYLGLQKRGFQLMAAFLLSIYILDVLRLSIFLFLIPLIWFYSFFDALQKVSKHGEEGLEDIPIVSYFVNHQRWFGIGLLLLGLYYMLDNLLIPSLGPALKRALDIDIGFWYYNYFQTTVLSILFIGGGLKLVLGSKKKHVDKNSTETKEGEVSP